MQLGTQGVYTKMSFLEVAATVNTENLWAEIATCQRQY